MSSAAGRLAVALGTAVLCGAALLVLLADRPPAAAPSVEELGELEALATAGARLHPVPPRVAARGSAAFCRECHPPSPHRGTQVRAAMQNAHAAWMDCLGCHWATEGGERAPASWLVASGGSAFAAVLPAERSTPAALAALRAQVTARRPCFPRGAACEDCHRAGGMAPWARGGAGASPGRASERLDAVFTLAPGEKWYFPQFP